MADDLLTVDQFAAKIKAKYPDYAQMDNNDLVNKIVAKYPDYKAQINFNSPSTAQQQPKGDSILGGMGNRLVDTVKGVLSTFDPRQTISSLSHGDIVNAVANTPAYRMAHGLVEAEKVAGPQAAQQFRDAANPQLDPTTRALKAAQGIVTGASMADPFAVPSVANINTLSNQGKVSQATGQGLADAAVLGAGQVAPKVVAGASKVAGKVAGRMYESALKPSTTIPAAQRAAIVQTGLDAGIPVSEAGAAKLTNLIDDLNQKVSAQIKAGAQAGQTIDPAAVASRVDQVRGRFTKQVNPDADLKAIDASKQEFLDNNQNPIPVDEAQALKQGTYQQLKSRAYGELKSATVESQKALARGIKEELETQFPEIKGLNAQEAKFYNLDGVLERAVNRIGNHQLIGIGTPIVGGAAGAAAGGPAAIASMILKATIDDPIVKSRLAIALSKAGKIPPAQAINRLSQYSTALAEANQKQEQ